MREREDIQESSRNISLLKSYLIYICRGVGPSNAKRKAMARRQHTIKVCFILTLISNGFFCVGGRGGAFGVFV